MSQQDEMRKLINLVEGANKSKLNEYEDPNQKWPYIEHILVQNKLRFDPQKPNPLISKPQKEIETYFKAFGDDQIAEIYQALEFQVANYKEKVSQMAKSLPNLDRIYTPEKKEKFLRILDLHKRAFEHYAKLEVAVQNVAANRGIAGQGPGDPEIKTNIRAVSGSDADSAVLGPARTRARTPAEMERLNRIDPRFRA